MSNVDTCKHGQYMTYCRECDAEYLDERFRAIAIAAARRRPKTPKVAECEAAQSGP